MPVSISVRSNVKDIGRSLSRAAYGQIDFAAAATLTALAKEIAAEESKNIAHTFESPRPFTVNSLGTHGARKSNLTAKVFVKPIAAKYLAPYETGGAHFLSGRALLNPKKVKLDKFGNLPRKKLAQLKARKDVFVGPVHFKATGETINGVWQRAHIRKKPRKVKGKRVRKESRGTGEGVDKSTHTSGKGKLLLLIRFGDALPVNHRLQYQARAQAIVDRRFNAIFGANLAKAIATAH